MNARDLRDLRDVGEEMDFVAYLVSKSADRVSPIVPRPLDLHVPHAGLESLLRHWSERVMCAVSNADDREVRS